MASERRGIVPISAKLLGIRLDYRDEPVAFSIADSTSSFERLDNYVEEEPHASEWFVKMAPTKASVLNYIRTLFPFWNWIFHYNLQWFLGDLIAGVTVGMVVIPQGMAYALLAKLAPEYGLYTSFVGFVLYWAFATSKDITIGTVAVMSTLVGNIVIKVQKEHPDIPAEQIARGLSVICGGVLLFIGLTRLGWIVEFIPLVAITSFMTGAAISIGVGQVPALLGISGVNTREAAYKVIINTLKGLPRAKLDAAMGLSALFLLYFIRWFCSFMSKKQANMRKFWFFMSTLRMAFVILLYILISWLVNRKVKTASKAKFKILGPVPRGFQHTGVPKIDAALIQAFASELPASLIVLLIEHIAISKSFGRLNNYTINPSQELVALGFTNLFGPFLGGYPATGSFSRTAIKSKAGVRTPLAGIFTAFVVLLALYALTSVFFYIPLSSLAGLIIHAVGDLITPPDVVYRYWEISPPEVAIFFAGVLVTIFTNIENGIYVAIGVSAGLLLFRIAKADGNFLGSVKTYTVDLNNRLDGRLNHDASQVTKEVFIPYNHSDGSNPSVDTQSPYPGIFIFRFSEGFSYANQSRYLDIITQQIFAETRRTTLENHERIGDRPWNDPGPRRGKQAPTIDHRPTLHAIILDFSSVNSVDVTSVQGLIDVRNQLDRYAAPDVVEWHFASVNNRWTKRALGAAGFGYPNASSMEKHGRWKPIVSIADISSARGEISREPSRTDEENGERNDADCIASSTAHEKAFEQTQVSSIHGGAALLGLNRPFFHVDVATALQNAIASAQREGL